MPIDLEHLKRLFLAALDIPNLASRGEFVQAETAHDFELRSRLKAMLAAHEKSQLEIEKPFLVSPFEGASLEAEILHPQLERPGQILAHRYQLLEHLGEGGMGSVWVAEQTEPVRRKVAIKLIKAGMDSRLVLSRFEVERQALALMDHSGIAKVFDGGMTDAGRPYFVMEYVEGQPITNFCDEQRLDIAARLRLFNAVCSAVQHAHQKGIIHRDLKPSNILVRNQDGHPVPKIIDFGLAKATDHRFSEQALQTAVGTMLGTPLYMSPEQAATDSVDVDTRTDIYSLGVVLYELLTGSTPLLREQFHKAAWQEMMHLIQEREPPRPSDRLSQSDTLPSVAASRHIEPKRLTQMVKGDLDWIVMKSLEKDRGRRYDSANSLADDVMRFLAGESVSAHPPQLSYRLRKLARKYFWQISGLVLILLALCTGLVGAIFGLRQASEREQIALRLAESERTTRRDAEARLRQLQTSNEILGSIFRDVDVNQLAEIDLKVKLGENLKAAALRIEAEATGDPLTVAAMQLRLGESLQGLAHYEAAIDLATKASKTLEQHRGPSDPETLKALRLLATSLHDAGKLQEACELYETIYSRRNATQGAEHQDTLISLADLASGERAQGKFDSAVERFDQAWTALERTLGPRHPETIRTLSKLAVARHLADQLDLALPLYRQALDLSRVVFGEKHPESIRALGNLAFGLRSLPDLPQALAKYRQAVDDATQTLGSNHPETLRLEMGLGGVYQAQGDFESAIKLYSGSLPKLKKGLGVAHPYTMSCLQSLGACLDMAGRSNEAIIYLEETWQARTKNLGETHPDTIGSLVDLAWCQAGMGKHQVALPLFRQAYELFRQELGAEDTTTLMSQCDYGQALCRNVQYLDAIQCLESTLDRTRSKLGPNHPNSVYCQGALGLALREAGKLDSAITTLQDARARSEAAFGVESPDTFRILVCQAECLRMKGQTRDAIALAREVAVKLDKKMGFTNPQTREAAICLANVLAQAGLQDEAMNVLEKVRSSVLGATTVSNVERLQTTAYLAETIRVGGDPDRALELMNPTVTDATQLLGDASEIAHGCREAQARCLADLRQWDAAKSHFQKVLEWRESHYGPEHWKSAQTRVRLGACELFQNRPVLTQKQMQQAYQTVKVSAPSESIEIGLLLLEGLTVAGEPSAARISEMQGLANDLAGQIRETRLEDTSRRADDLERVAQALLKIGDSSQAEGLCRETLAIRESVSPSSWRTFQTQIHLGMSLRLGQKFDEAEKELLAGYAKLEAAQASIPEALRKQTLDEAVRAIIDLYQTWNKPEELQAWRARLNT